MSMTVVVTRNVSGRMRGFLASTMLELTPGVYSAPRISPAVRARIWAVLSEWFVHEKDASAIMIWQEREIPGGQAVKTLGIPPIRLIEVDGILLAHEPVDETKLLDSSAPFVH
jgi:CRISPR-associated protein Cas2